MVFINYTMKQLAAKIVYFGPGLSGKTTNLKQVYLKTAPASRGELVSLETDADRTLFFDLLPIEVGIIGGFQTKFQLYTVPGQVHYESTRNLVLKGVDGLVFVADSQREMLDANKENLGKLYRSLAQVDIDSNEVPMVFQYNKRDLPNLLSVAELNAELNPRGCPSFEAVAEQGKGVFETLKGITKLTLKSIKAKLAAPAAAQAKPKPAAAAPPPPPPPPPPEEAPAPKERERVPLTMLRDVPDEQLEQHREASFSSEADGVVSAAEEELAEEEEGLSEKTSAEPAEEKEFGKKQEEELFSDFFKREKAGEAQEETAVEEEEEEAGEKEEDVEFAELDEGAMLEEPEFSPQVEEDFVTVHFEQARGKQANMDPDMGLPVRRVAVDRTTDIQKTLEELVQMAVGPSRPRKGKRAGRPRGKRKPKPALTKKIKGDFDVTVPRQRFNGTKYLRFDIVFDGERPMRVRDAFVVDVDEIEGVRNLLLRLNVDIKTKARKRKKRKRE
jgi:signal recognition particle receptor subunit beta